MDLQTTPAAPAKPRRAWMWIALAVALVAILGVGAYLALGRGSGASLTSADRSCNDGRTDTRIGDGGKTLIINSSGDPIKSIVDTQTVACVLDYLKTPAAVRSHIDSTRALDGRQTDSWDRFTAAWTYHPDDGLDITIEQK
jgi:hypothetical protein